MKKSLHLTLLMLFLGLANGLGAQTTISLPFVHDFEGDNTGTAAAPPAGWTRINDATGTANYYPYISSSFSSAHSGSKYLYFYLSTSDSYANSEYMVLPAVAAGHDMQHVRMDFWARRSTNDAMLYVGVMSDATDTATFVAVDSVSMTNTYQRYSVSLAGYTGTGRHLALCMRKTSSLTYGYIDDLYIVEEGACPAPDSLWARALSETSALAGWSDNTGTMWNVYWGSPAADSAFADSMMVTTNPAVISGLEAGTEYRVSVAAVCTDGTTSAQAWPATLRTPCTPIPFDSLPYTYGFEDATASGNSGSINSCYTRHEYTRSSNYPYPSTTNKHSGSYGMYMYCNTTNYSWLALPRFENQLSDLQLTFWAYKTSANYGQLVVGVMTDPDDISTFDTIATVQVNATSTWEMMEVPLSRYSDTGRYIAIMANTGATNIVYIDDLTVDLLPMCPRPDNIAAENATAHSFVATWHSDAYAYEYEVEYGLMGFELGTGMRVTAYDTSAELTGLDYGKGYDVWVRAVCGTDTSTWNMATLYPACTELELADLPYIEDFETYGSGSAYPISHCWTKYSSSTTAYPYPYSTAAINGARGLYFYGYTSSTASNYSYAVLPPVSHEVQMNTLMLQFAAKRYSSTTSSYHSMIVVGVADNLDSVEGFTPIDTIDLTSEAASSIHNIEVSFATYADTGRYVVLYAPSPGTSSHYNYIYVDDVTLMRIPTCYRPTELTTSHIYADSACLVWSPDSRTPSPASGYVVEYGETGFEQGMGTTVYTHDTVITIDNLLPSTGYDVYVSADCGGGDISDPRSMSFATTCQALPVDSLPYLENFDSYPAGTTVAAGQEINPCWFKGTSSTSDYPYLYTTRYHSAPNSMYFYATATAYSYLALPAFEADLDQLELSFDLNKTAANYARMRIGVMDNPLDAETFTTVAHVQPSEINTWERFTVRFDSYEGMGRHIAFMLPDSVTSYAQLDNISVVLASDCPTPQNPVVTGVSHNSATLAWEADSTAQEWTVYYGTPGFDPDTALQTIVDTPMAVIINLEPNTDYAFSVVASCAGTPSNGSFPMTFRTACLPIPADSLPYIENFDSYPATTAIAAGQEMNPCWNKGTNNTSDYPFLYNTNSVSTPNSLRFYSTTTYYSYATLPLFASDIHTLRVNFDLVRTSTYTGKLVVGVMSNPYEISTFVPVATCYPGDIPSGQHVSFEVGLDAYNGPAGHIAFLAPNDSTNYAHLDNVVVSLLPDCRRSSNLAASGVGSHDATLSWFNSSTNASEYQVAYGPAATFHPDTNASYVSSPVTSVTLTGLADYSRYAWAVRAMCGSDTGAWSAISGFRTILDCGEHQYNTVDTLGDGTSSSSTYAFYGSTSYPTGYSRHIITIDELAAMNITANNRINGISLYCGATGGTIYNASIYLTETELEGFSSTPANDTLNPQDMALVFHGDIVCTPNEWVEIFFDTVYPFDGNSNLMLVLSRNSASSAAVSFRYTSTSPNYYTCYGYRTSSSTANNTAVRATSRPNIIFNICSEIPTCDRPVDVNIAALSPDSLAVTWQGSNTSYETALGPTGFNPDTIPSLSGIHQYTTSEGIAYGGLTPNTEYDFYVRGFCSTGDTSDWTVALRFATPCTPSPLPFTEDFESYGSGSTVALNSCWKKGTNQTTAYPYPYSTNAINGSRSLYFYASHTSTTNNYSYAALPLMAAPVDSLQITFNMRRYSSTTASYTSRLVVGLMTNPSDIATFTPVDTIDLHDEEPLSVTGVEVAFAGYPNSGQYIALYDESPELYEGLSTCYSYVYVDDIIVDYIPTCPAPVNLLIPDSGITATTAQVSWTNRAAAAMGYQIEYGPAGFLHGAGTTTTSSTTTATLTGLASGTTYDVYVRTICSGADTGNWSFPTSFTSLCTPNTDLPITYDFEGLPTGSNARFPVCWNRLNNGTTYGYYPYINSSTTNAHSGSNYLYWFSSTATTYGDYAVAVLPEIDTNIHPANTIEIIFWGKSSSTSSYDHTIEIGMMSDPADNSTFSIMQTITLTPTMTEYHIPFNSYTGHGSYPAFRKNRGTQTGYAYIDDITIAKYSACPRPFAPQAIDVTTTTATLTWSDTSGATQWQVICQPLDGGAPTTATSTDDTLTLTGLAPATFYTFRVQGLCPTSSEFSDVSLTAGHFATTQEPATVPVFYNFEDSAQWNAWQTVSNSHINWYRGTAAASDGSHSIYISADQGATRSTNMQAVVNACAYRDIDFGTEPSSCNVTFRINVGGSQAANYDGVSVMLVDPVTYVEPSTANLTTPWGHVNERSLSLIRNTSGWQTHTVALDNVSGVKRLVLYWFNQATGQADFLGLPPAIDSLSVYDQPCPRPFDLAVTSLTDGTATLTWSSLNTSANYIVAYREASQTPASNRYDTVASTFTTLYGLTSNTEYTFWVRSLCDSVTTSAYSTGLRFQTPCGLHSAFDTIHEDFESTAASAYNTEGGALPECWDGYTNGSSALYTPHVVNTGTYWYTVDGSQSVILTSGSSATYGNTKILRLPMTAEPVNSLTLTYWMCTEGSTQGTLSIGYMTGINYETDFVPIKDIPASTLTQHSGSGLQTNRGLRDTVTFDSVPDNALYVAFRWYHNSTFYSVCLDDINLTSSISCPSPAIVSVRHTYESINLGWMSSADTLDVAITPGPWSSDITPLATVVGTNGYNFTGLTPSTTYTVGVRQHCSTGSTSRWATALVTTDTLNCLIPSGLNVTDVTNSTATLDWTSGAEQNWDIHIWFSGGLDSIYRVNTHPVTVGGFHPGVQYNYTVRSLCGNSLIEGDWSDTATFTTLTCPVVAGLNTSDITTSSVTLNWTANPMAESWIIEYGYAGFDQGTGTTTTATTNSLVVTGLECATQYDFFVRAVCGADWTSENWALTNATTAECAQACEAPTGIETSVTANSVAVSWTPAEGNTAFEVEYGLRGFRHGTGTILSTSESFTTINGLEHGTQYDLYVRALCGADNYSPWSTVSTFTTETQGIDAVGTAACTIFPNPASGSTTVSVSGVSGKVKIEVVDMNGRTVATETLECSADCQKAMDVDGLSQGAYFVRITADQVNMVKKLIIR